MSVNEKESLPVDSESDLKPKKCFPRFRRTGCAATSFFELPPDVISKRFSTDANRSKSSVRTPSSGNEQLNLRSRSTDSNIEKKPKTVPSFKIADVRKTNFDLPGQLSSKKSISDYSSSTSKVILPTLPTVRMVIDKDQSSQLNALDIKEKNEDEFKSLNSIGTNSEKASAPRISSHLSSSLSRLNTSLPTSKSDGKVQANKRYSLFHKDNFNKSMPEIDSPLMISDDKDNKTHDNKDVAAKMSSQISKNQTAKECDVPGNAIEKSKQNIFIQNYLSRCMDTQRKRGKETNIQTINTHPAKKMISKFQPDKNVDLRRNEEREASVLEKALNSIDNKEIKKTDLLRRKFEVKSAEDTYSECTNSKREKNSLQQLPHEPFLDNSNGDNKEVISVSGQEAKDFKDLRNEFKCNTSMDADYKFVQDSVKVPSHENNESNSLRDILLNLSKSKLSNLRNDDKKELEKEENYHQSKYLVEKLNVEMSPYNIQNETDFNLISFEDFNGEASQVNEKSLIATQERKISVSSTEGKSQQRKISINMHRTDAAKEDKKAAILGRIITFKESQNLGSGSIKDITNFSSNSKCSQTSATIMDFEQCNESFSDETEVKSFSIDKEQNAFMENQHSHRNILPSDFGKMCTSPDFSSGSKMNDFRSKQESVVFDDDNITFDSGVDWENSMNDREESFKGNFMQTSETGYTEQNFTRKAADNRSQFQKELNKENRIYSGMTSQSAAFRTERLQQSIILNRKSSTSTVTRKLRIGQKTFRKTSRYTRYEVSFYVTKFVLKR